MRKVKIIASELYPELVGMTVTLKVTRENDYILYFYDKTITVSPQDVTVKDIQPASILMATFIAYNEIPRQEFHGNDLVRRVRILTERPELYDGSITKRLRELRHDGRLNYDVIDNAKSLYRKK